MQSDRELLEAAAKAAGLRGHRYCDAWEVMAAYTLQDGYHGPSWNPLTDDGDALRLAVALRIQVLVEGCSTFVAPFYRGSANATEPHGDDADAATRRAIVRAAAAMASQEV